MTFAGNVLTIVDLKKAEDFSEVQQIARKNFMMDVSWKNGEQIKKYKNCVLCRFAAE